VCTLARLHDTVVREAMASPSVIVVGDVFKGLLEMQNAHAEAPLQASR
jgi:uroporphyrin-III C-methyltransferase